MSIEIILFCIGCIAFAVSWLPKSTKIVLAIMVCYLLVGLFSGVFSLWLLPILVTGYFALTINDGAIYYRNTLLVIGFFGCLLFLLPLPGATYALVVLGKSITLSFYTLFLYFIVYYTFSQQVSVKNLLFGVLAFAPLGLSFGFIVTLFYCGYTYPFAALAPEFLFIIFAKILISAAIEEMVFRQFMQNTLINIYENINPLWLVLLTSLIFGLVHAWAGIIAIGLATVAGLLYGLTFHYTRKIEYSIALHFIVNAARLVICSL